VALFAQRRQVKEQGPGATGLESVPLPLGIEDEFKSQLLIEIKSILLGLARPRASIIPSEQVNPIFLFY
jgi:hypothetical protein